MSWQELGHSSGVASLACLLSGATPTVSDESVPLEAIAERLVLGGFPGLLGASETQARDVNRAYLELIAETDISRISRMKRDPRKVNALLRSLARNTATLAEVTTLAADIGEREKADILMPSYRSKTVTGAHSRSSSERGRSIRRRRI